MTMLATRSTAPKTDHDGAAGADEEALIVLPQPV